MILFGLKMLIQELLEHVEDKNNNGIDDKLEFDLAEDLTFFMNNDDDIYRRQVYPSVMKFKQSNGNCDKSVFRDAVHSAYESYCKKFPIKHLPQELPKEVHEQVCNTLLQNMQNENQED